MDTPNAPDPRYPSGSDPRLDEPGDDGKPREYVWEVYPHSVQIVRPGHEDVYLGFAHATTAEQVARSLTQQLQHTEHVAGTAIYLAHTPGTAPIVRPLPLDAGAVTEALYQEDAADQPPGERFPDVFARLHAQYGYEEACRVHRVATEWMDAETPDEEPERDGDPWAAADDDPVALRTRIAELESQLRGVYVDRAYLLAALAADPTLHARQAVDEKGLDGFTTVLYLNSPETEQISFHIADEDRELFEHVPWAEPGDPLAQWDGSDKETVLARLRTLVEHRSNTDRKEEA